MAPFSVGHELNFRIASFDDADNSIRFAFMRAFVRYAALFLPLRPF